MDNDWEKNALWRVLTQRNVLAIVTAAVLVSNAFLSAYILYRGERIVLQPSAAAQHMWASRQKVSDTYIESHSMDVVMLALNVTPATAEFNKDVLLRMAHPGAFGALDRDLTKRNAWLEKSNVSTTFQPGSGAVVEAGARQEYYRINRPTRR